MTESMAETRIRQRTRSFWFLGTNEDIPRKTMVYRAVKKVHDQIAASPMPKLPLIFSEYGASYSNEPSVEDSPYMGPWLANTIRQCDGLIQNMSYWSFSDVFEEMMPIPCSASMRIKCPARNAMSAAPHVLANSQDCLVPTTDAPFWKAPSKMLLDLNNPSCWPLHATKR